VQLDMYIARADTDVSPTLGIPATSTQLQLQTDAFKELVNKVAWALGSTYRRPYSNGRTVARQVASRLVARLILDHGYPAQLGMPAGPGSAG